ncbi:hypothetical protein Y032_0835g2599 [Ancylostoma ceylanicum]|nr:hypothetical protein Y032_0835g2599 [Ancylostoma ceylanicum]
MPPLLRYLHLPAGFCVRVGIEMATKPRFDWFQTDTCVTITILKKGVALSDCRVTFNDNDIKVYYGDEVIFETTLARPVDEKNFTVTCTPSKVSAPRSCNSVWYEERRFVLILQRLCGRVVKSPDCQSEGHGSIPAEMMTTKGRVLAYGSSTL